MIALLRYAFVKSARERLLHALLSTPFVMLFAPVLGVAAGSAVMGRGQFPIRLPGLSAASSASGMFNAATVLATIAAATAGFWIFRREVATRDIGVFLLATRSRTIILAATAYGAMVALASYFVSVAFTGLLTTHLPPQLGVQVLFAILSCISAAALGASLVAISPEVTMLIPLYALTFCIAFFLLESRFLFVAPAIVGSALLVGASTILLRRRCAT